MQGEAFLWQVLLRPDEACWPAFLPAEATSSQGLQRLQASLELLQDCSCPGQPQQRLPTGNASAGLCQSDSARRHLTHLQSTLKRDIQEGSDGAAASAAAMPSPSASSHPEASQSTLQERMQAGSPWVAPAAAVPSTPAPQHPDSSQPTLPEADPPGERGGQLPAFSSPAPASDGHARLTGVEGERAGQLESMAGGRNAAAGLCEAGSASCAASSGPIQHQPSNGLPGTHMVDGMARSSGVTRDGIFSGRGQDGVGQAASPEQSTVPAAAQELMGRVGSLDRPEDSADAVQDSQAGTVRLHSQPKEAQEVKERLLQQQQRACLRLVTNLLVPAGRSGKQD